MNLGIRKLPERTQFALVSGLAIVGSVFLLRLTGLLQLFELNTFDLMIRLRPPEQIDNRIIIIGIDETDFRSLNNAIITDQVMADLLQKVKAQRPRLIGLDLYRNLPAEPGHQDLLKIFQTTPNLIGIKKVIATEHLSSVDGNTTLMKAGQIAASDILADSDGRVRRVLLVPNSSENIYGLGFRLALDYLASEGITPDDNPTLTIAGISIPPFNANDGGYVRADGGGYQILLNLRGPSGHFQRVSLRDVCQGKIAPDLFRDRIVLIGNTNIVDRDLFLTSYTNTINQAISGTIYGVELHANVASQIISAVLEGRPLIRVLPQWVEIILISACALVGISLQRQRVNYFWSGILTLIAASSLLGGSYLLLIQGWWIPVVPASISLILASIVMGSFNAQYLKMLATQDELTKVANRRTFNESLATEWYRALRSHRPISLILCDVDHFKLYNDTYGHRQGDECLRQVAGAIQSATRRTQDLAARYGGEEFAVLLPNTDANGALTVAESIRQRVMALKLEHRSSRTSGIVTLSLGVTSIIPSLDVPPSSLVDTADLGLYQAKHEGRNRTRIKLP